VPSVPDGAGSPDAKAVHSGGTERHISGPRIAVIVDEARTLVANARASGLRPTGLLISDSDYQSLVAAKSYEDRSRVPLQLLGLHVEPSELDDEGREPVLLRFADS